MTVGPARPFNKTLYLRAEFEDPLSPSSPLIMDTKIEPWMLPLVARFGHGRTAREVYDGARQESEVPEGFGPDDFATLVAMMIERGYLEVSDLVLEE